MKMHDPAHNDPLIDMPEPVTLVLPALEKTLSSAAITADRETIAEKFMAGAPRIGIVHGGSGHPAQTGDSETALLCVRRVWEKGGLPFDICRGSVCDGIAQGHRGMAFSLLSRNSSRIALAGELEAHRIDGAVILTSCDKTPVADVCATVDIDIMRKINGERPFHAFFIPPVVMEEGDIPDSSKKLLAEIRKSSDDREITTRIDALINQKLKCNTYAQFRELADLLIDKKIINSHSGDNLLKELAVNTCKTGGTCSFLGTGMTSQFVLAGLGVIPGKLSVRPACPEENAIGSGIGLLIERITSHDSARSVSEIVKENFYNAVKIWDSIGGSLNWVLHFLYLARALEMDCSIADLAAAGPGRLLNYSPERGGTMYDLAEDCEKENTDFTVLIAEKLHENAAFEMAPTFSGTWEKSFKGNNASRKLKEKWLIQPERGSGESNIIELSGNIGESMVIKMGGFSGSRLRLFENKVYCSLVCTDEKDFRVLTDPAFYMERLDERLSPGALEIIQAMNISPGSSPGVPGPSLEYLFNEEIIRILFIIAGQGPNSWGMPELYYPSSIINHSSLLSSISGILTDGRFSGATFGPCIGHCYPEALNNGPIASIDDGDLVHINLEKKTVNIIDIEKTSSGPAAEPVYLEQKTLMKRKTGPERMEEIKQKRSRFPASIRRHFELLGGSIIGADYD